MATDAVSSVVTDAHVPRRVQATASRIHAMALNE
jgi:hypothetical protein